MNHTPDRGGVEHRLPQTIEHVAIETLIPYARNARMHSPAQVAQLAASMREFGWTNPVLIDDAGGIIAGHGRVLAARSLGMTAVPCVRLAHLTEAQKRALVLADNKLAENAGWDEALLAEELHALAAIDFDLGLVGFAEKEIEDLLDETERKTIAPMIVREQFLVLVELNNEDEQIKVIEKLLKEGYKCRALIS